MDVSYSSWATFCNNDACSDFKRRRADSAFAGILNVLNLGSNGSNDNNEYMLVVYSTGVII